MEVETCVLSAQEERSEVVVSPRLLFLVCGGEGEVLLSNKRSVATPWKLAWDDSLLWVDPSSGSLAAGGDVLLCVTALQGQGLRHGNIHIYCLGCFEDRWGYI